MQHSAATLCAILIPAAAAASILGPTFFGCRPCRHCPRSLGATVHQRRGRDPGFVTAAQVGLGANGSRLGHLCLLGVASVVLPLPFAFSNRNQLGSSLHRYLATPRHLGNPAACCPRCARCTGHALPAGLRHAATSPGLPPGALAPRGHHPQGVELQLFYAGCGHGGCPQL